MPRPKKLPDSMTIKRPRRKTMKFRRDMVSSQSSYNERRFDEMLLRRGKKMIAAKPTSFHEVCKYITLLNSLKCIVQ